MRPHFLVSTLTVGLTRAAVAADSRAGCRTAAPFLIGEVGPKPVHGEVAAWSARNERILAQLRSEMSIELLERSVHTSGVFQGEKPAPVTMRDASGAQYICGPADAIDEEGDLWSAGETGSDDDASKLDASNSASSAPRGDAVLAPLGGVCATLSQVPPRMFVAARLFRALTSAHVTDPHGRGVPFFSIDRPDDDHVMTRYDRAGGATSGVTASIRQFHVDHAAAGRRDPDWSLGACASTPPPVDMATRPSPHDTC